MEINEKYSRTLGLFGAVILLLSMSSIEAFGQKTIYNPIGDTLEAPIESDVTITFPIIVAEGELDSDWDYFSVNYPDSAEKPPLSKSREKSSEISFFPSPVNLFEFLTKRDSTNVEIRVLVDTNGFPIEYGVNHSQDENFQKAIGNRIHKLRFTKGICTHRPANFWVVVPVDANLR